MNMFNPQQGSNAYGQSGYGQPNVRGPAPQMFMPPNGGPQMGQGNFGNIMPNTSMGNSNQYPTTQMGAQFQPPQSNGQFQNPQGAYQNPQMGSQFQTPQMNGGQFPGQQGMPLQNGYMGQPQQQSYNMGQGGNFRPNQGFR